MSKTKVLAAAVVLGVGIATLAIVHSESKRSTKGATLTPMDYIEIQQLVARYAMALDTGAENGYMYADLFTPDGVFLPNNGGVVGREKLAALARGHMKEQGPLYVRDYTSNHIIEPSPEGATGRLYLVAMGIGDRGQPSGVLHGGHYEDVYVRTTDGWRIKSRTYVASKSGPAPAAR
jgi:hypothetical protein